MKNFYLLTAALPLVAALIAGPSRASASDPESLTQLAGQVERLEARGFTCDDYAMGRWLGAGESADYEVVLPAGYEYVIPATGDTTTRDLDLAIYDERGNFIDGDDLPDVQPYVVVEPAWTGEFTVRMTMASGHGNANFAVCFH